VSGDRYETIRFEAAADDLVAWMVLDRPARLNAMTAQMRREILDVLDRVHTGDWRVLAIRGEGRAFCSGADLEQILKDVDVTDAPVVRQFMLDGWQLVVERMRRCRVPTVAAVHGAAYGGGANIALAADLVVAADSAVFCQSYVDRGITPDLGATWMLPRLAGLQQARRMLLLGEQVTADEALRLGLVAEVVPDDRLVERTAELASALAAKPPESIAIIRDLIERNIAADLPTALAAEADGVAVTLGGAGFRESLAAFAASRAKD
jgi:2-(1,2-epoxy-1,2-dihydrophenyl)acetyl-CoA isomerase